MEIASAASKVIVSKGKKVSAFAPKNDPLDEIADAMLGPTGNLRAPTIKSGKTVFVGFNDEAYTEHFGD